LEEWIRGGRDLDPAKIFEHRKEKIPGRLSRVTESQGKDSRGDVLLEKKKQGKRAPRRTGTHTTSGKKREGTATILGANQALWKRMILTKQKKAKLVP